jgi:hypothetical protein
MIRGIPANQTRDAREMKGLELMETDDLQPFQISPELPAFTLSKAQWPRARQIYRAPVLIVKETLSAGPRALVAVAERDLVYTNAFFGAALPPSRRTEAHLIAGILSSALASWFFLMTASEFGIWKRRLLRHDVSLLPTPDPVQAVKSDAGTRLLEMERSLRRKKITDDDWSALDEVVFDLYDLETADRVVVRDGLYRASWQWQEGRESAAENADIERDLRDYAAAFISVIGGWLAARNKRRIRAEIFKVPAGDAVRVVRFVLEDGAGAPVIDVLDPGGDLHQLLQRIGTRLNVKIATALTAVRELRIHGRNEVVVIKPSARRYWMGVSALEDADAVVAETFTRAARED